MIHDPDPRGVWTSMSTADGAPAAAQGRTQGERRPRSRPARLARLLAACARRAVIAVAAAMVILGSIGLVLTLLVEGFGDRL